MNKIIIQVFLPVNGKTYDVRLPESMYVHDVTEVLSELFAEIAKGFYCKGDVNILCFKDCGESLPHDKTLKELGVSNRASMMFI